jgi:hypothetical protein
MCRARSAEIVSGPTPPELSAPSLEAVGNVGGRRARLQLLEIGNARELAVNAIQARLEFLLQPRERAPLQRVDRLSETRRSAFLTRRHAARVVHEDRDDVLLRLQLADHHDRLPDERQQHRDQRGLKQPDHAGAPGSERRDRAWQPRANHPREDRRGCRDREPQDPRWPRSEQDDVASGEDRARVLEQELEHGGTAGDSVARRVSVHS